MISWHCHDVFDRMPPQATAGGIAVILDVLRASTTMITALAHGAARIVPVASLEAARAVAAAVVPPPLLGGERGGLRIAGFDLGNSPLEYEPGIVQGKTIVITTTNGTAALHAAHEAREILIGGIVNRTAVARMIRQTANENDVVHLVCAGTDGLVTAEDLLAAGAILDAAEAIEQGDLLDDSAHDAVRFFRRVARGEDLPRALVAEFRRAPGGSNLVGLGMAADLAAAAAIDTLDVVPRFDAASGSLTAPSHVWPSSP